MNRKWKAVGLVLGIVIVVVIVAFFALSYLGLNPLYQFPSAYTKVVVPSGNYGSYTDSGSYATTVYTFAWGSSEVIYGQYNDQTKAFFVGTISYVKDSIVPSNQNFTSYPVSLDTTYEMGSKSSVYGGIEIKVSEIHSDYIVLLVKPL
ncbi:MAG: hypothetical protein ABSD73_02190 [Candidatus Bathyarchaeia archaeon]